MKIDISDLTLELLKEREVLEIGLAEAFTHSSIETVNRLKKQLAATSSLLAASIAADYTERR